MTDQSNQRSGPGGGTDNPALARSVLRHRVRTITGGAVDLDRQAGGDSSAAGSLAAVVVDQTAYVQTADERGLGPALRWAATNGADRLTLIAEEPVAAGLARRAALLAFEIVVWSARGPDVEPAVAAPAATPPPLPADHRRFAAVISEAGARPIDDHGMLVAEVAGLEVARVVDDEPDVHQGRDHQGRDHQGTGTAREPRLAVGVGQADRELQQYLHRHLDDDANLRRAIAAVARHRHPGSAAHPLTRVARQRWLRSVLLDEPGQLDLPSLEPVVPLRPRDTVLGTEPVAAAGEATVVVCSVGVDLDLLPEAVDYRRRDDPDAELVVVVPERDRRLATSTLARFVPRLRVASIDPPWGR